MHMKKSLSIIMAVVVIVGGGIGLYVALQHNDNETGAGNTVTNTLVSNANAYMNVNTATPGTYIGDGFTLLQLPGWIQGHLSGTLVSFHNEREQQPAGSAAAAINFQSYIAVSFDTTNGRSPAEVYQRTIDDIISTIDGVNIFDTDDETVNGLTATFTAMEFVQQDVEYTVMVAVYDAGDRYYVVSFNTTSELWIEYKDSFYEVARSFMLKL